MDLNQLVASASNRFHKRYDRDPRWIAAAPGRVNIIGEHVDYNAGFVLPMAIDRYCVIAAAENDEARMTNDECKTESDHSSFVIRHSSLNANVYSASADEEVTISLRKPGATGSASAVHTPGATGSASALPKRGHWSNYVAGVIAGCAVKDMQPAGFQAVIDSTVPVGGGLSSSAAIEVATATLIEAMTGTSLNLVEKALLCQKAEHEFAGVPCGIMDQFASAMCRADRLMLLDCRSQQMEHVPFTDPAITVLIINSNVKHTLTGGEYAERRAQCESAARKLGIESLREISADELETTHHKLSDAEYLRARHAVSEIARTTEAASALKKGDWSRVGELMYASHESLRDDYEVSCRELDLLVELAADVGPRRGVMGSRMTGGGFGGCTVSLVRTEAVDEIAQRIVGRYREETGIDPAVLVSRPARGAHVIKAG